MVVDRKDLALSETRSVKQQAEDLAASLVQEYRHSQPGAATLGLIELSKLVAQLADCPPPPSPASSGWTPQQERGTIAEWLLSEHAMHVIASVVPMDETAKLRLRPGLRALAAHLGTAGPRVDVLVERLAKNPREESRAFVRAKSAMEEAISKLEMEGGGLPPGFRVRMIKILRDGLGG